MKLADSRIFTIASKNFERLSRAARSTPRRLARLRFKNDAAVKLGLRKMRPTTHTHAPDRPTDAWNVFFVAHESRKFEAIENSPPC